MAFSGGADSALLAAVATELLGQERVLCVTAVSPSLPRDELADCSALAFEWGLRWETAATDELADPRYRDNGADRCAYCKTALIDALQRRAVRESARSGGNWTVALGVNLDDLGDHRPGQIVAKERGAAFPLVDAELSKEAVRELSRWLGLRTADKPAAACLASRIPYGTPVTLGVLGMVERAERALRRLGFSQLRVRHHGEIARIEMIEEEIGRALLERAAIAAAVRSAGYRYATLDLESYRSGRLNEALARQRSDRGLEAETTTAEAH